MDSQLNQSKAGRITNRWRVVLVILACLITLYVAYRFVLGHAVDVRIEAIRRAGLPATCAEFDKWYTHVPAGENAADFYIQAGEHYNRWTNTLSQPIFITNTWTHPYRARKKSDLLPIEGDVKLPPRTEQLPAEMKQLIGEYLTDNAEALRLLHQAASTKRCRFLVDLDKGPCVLDHMSQPRQGVRLLMLEAIENSESQKPEQAAESVVASLAITRALNQEPVIISRLVAIACHGVSIESLQHVLNRTPLTDEQLVKLAVALMETEDPQGLTRMFIGERCFGIDRFEQIRQDKWRSSSDDTSYWYAQLFRCLWKASGLLELDELAYLNLMHDFVKATQLSPPQSIAATKALTVKAKQLPFYVILSRRTLDGLDNVVTFDVRQVARVRTAVASLAIERYRLAKGDLPEKLSDVVPTYLDAIPQDPFDGKPLRYKKLVRGYVVYSVGDDGEDNGGAELNSEGLSVGKGTDITFIIER